MSIFSKATATALLAGMLTFGTASFADTYEERLAVAQAYSEMSVADTDMDALIEQMYAPILGQIQTQNQLTFTPEQMEKVHALYMAAFDTPMRELMLGQATVMADIMSLDEITALHDFYSTDLGRSSMKKLPEILAANQPQILQMVQSKMPVILQELGSILELN